MSKQSFTLNQARNQTGQRVAEGSRVYQQAKKITDKPKNVYKSGDNHTVQYS
jgi:hypothetical protein